MTKLKNITEYLRSKGYRVEVKDCKAVFTTNFWNYKTRTNELKVCTVNTMANARYEIGA